MSQSAVKDTIRVYLLDDHVMIRRGVRSFLEAEQDLQVAGESGRVSEALTEVLELSPDVAVLDVELPDGNGIDLCRQIRSLDPTIKVVVHGEEDDEDMMVSAYLAGASGYLHKQSSVEDLVKGVRWVGQGWSLIQPHIAMRVIELRKIEQAAAPDAMASLTATQAAILELITDGLTNKQIGERLYLAEKTVKNHVTTLFAKLGVQGRTQAAVLASRYRG